MKQTSPTVFLLAIFIVVSCLSFKAVTNERFVVTDGLVWFKSNAPLELIEARSNQLKGLIDVSSKKFAFSVPLQSFDGFNSPLQKEHFNENYVHSYKYPAATFEGKIIEDIGFGEEGKQTIRAKGNFTINGISQERIIRSEIELKPSEVNIISNFTVLLKDHNITIPKIVNQKIAEEIEVEVRASFKKK